MPSIGHLPGVIKFHTIVHRVMARFAHPKQTANDPVGQVGKKPGSNS